MSARGPSFFASHRRPARRPDHGRAEDRRRSGNPWRVIPRQYHLAHARLFLRPCLMRLTLPTFPIAYKYAKAYATRAARMARSAHKLLLPPRLEPPSLRCRRRESGNAESPDAADTSEKAVQAEQPLFFDSRGLSPLAEPWPEALMRKRSGTQLRRDCVRRACPLLRRNGWRGRRKAANRRSRR